jgi:hypothetical protein
MQIIIINTNSNNNNNNNKRFINLIRIYKSLIIFILDLVKVELKVKMK